MNKEQQRAFFDEQWPELKTVLESDGAGALVRRIDAFPAEQRMALFTCARNGLVMDEWRGRNLDDYVTVADAGIRWLSSVAAASKPNDRPLFLGAANVISFNLAADLADCWPGDDVERTRAHFERGRDAGEACVAWRRELGVSPNSQQLGWWALGYHQLRLEQFDEAYESFGNARRWAVKDAAQDAAETHVGVAAPFSVNLNAGYQALAAWARGDEEAAEAFGEALDAFRSQLENPERADDAQFGLDQLGKVRDLVGR